MGIQMMTRRIAFIFLILFSGSVVVHANQSTDQQFQGFDLAGYDNGGNKTWDINGDKADIMGDIIKMTNIVANAYGDQNMHLTAKRGTLDKVNGNIHLEEDVVITTDTGAKLVTDSLDWDRNQDLVQTDDHVVLTREKMVASGTGMKAKPDLKTAQMNEDVDVKIDMEFKDEPGRIITITCDGPLEIDYQKELAIFNENVIAIDGDRKLVTDKLELYFDTATSKIKEIICIGNVAITQGENTSYSQRAVYKAQEQRVILTGRPKIIFYAKEEK